MVITAMAPVTAAIPPATPIRLPHSAVSGASCTAHPTSRENPPTTAAAAAAHFGMPLTNRVRATAASTGTHTQIRGTQRSVPSPSRPSLSTTSNSSYEVRERAPERSQGPNEASTTVTSPARVRARASHEAVDLRACWQGPPLARQSSHSLVAAIAAAG